MSYYMIFRSDQDLNFFPENKPSLFKCKLQQNIDLAGDWTIALTEITLRETVGNETELCIYSNVCGESFIHGRKAPLLRRVVVDTNANTILTSYYYKPVIKTELGELEFRLESINGTKADHILQPITLVVHFTAS